MKEIKSSLMSYSTYLKTQHKSPYFFKIEKNGKVIYYFGSNHSFDPKDKQYPLLKKYWKEFSSRAKPNDSIVFNEGGIRDRHKTIKKAISSDAEVGLTIYLGEQKEYQVFSPDPDRKTLTKHLLHKYTREEIQYYYFSIMVYYWAKVPNRPTFEEYVNQFLKNGTDESGWSDFDFSISNMKKIHRSLFKGEFSESDTEFFQSLINPCFRTTIINCFSQDNGIERDAFIVNKILAEWEKGKNLFIVFGHTHAVMQEPSLRKLT